MIEGHEDGPIYFAGDTAPLDYKREAVNKDDSYLSQRARFVNMDLEKLNKDVIRYQEKVENGDIKFVKLAKVAKNVLEYKNIRANHLEKIERLEQKIKDSQDSTRRVQALMEKLHYHMMQEQEARHLAIKGDYEAFSHIDAIRQFKPAYYFSPGGPDEVRADMETTHQCSAYGLQAHVEILLQGIDSKNLTKEEFLEEAHKRKTVYMHTMTFKLGNLKLLDTPDSLERVLLALEHYSPGHIDILQSYLDEIKTTRPKDIDAETRIITKKDIKPKDAKPSEDWRLGLRDYEWDIVLELIRLSKEIKLKDGETLTTKELAQLLKETVVVPKIGSNIGLRSAKNSQEEKVFF